jgi:hypothetical protein
MAMLSFAQVASGRTDLSDGVARSTLPAPLQ